MRHRRTLAGHGTLAVIALACACADPPSGDPPFRLSDHATHTVGIVAEFPHDPEAFTQGLVWQGGLLYESTGRYGQSSVRTVAPETGQVLSQVDLEEDYFGEGLALVGDALIQLTWTEETAFVWSADALTPIGTFDYQGQGWGLCHDGTRLVMSDGSSTLQFRDADTFELTGTLAVTFQDKPVRLLNELECVDAVVFANVWQSDIIVGIDTASGAVEWIIDASPLRQSLAAGAIDVLNGIAVDGDSGAWLLTGKLWPTLFAVELVPLE